MIFVCPLCLKAVSVVLLDPEDIPFLETLQARGITCPEPGCAGEMFHHSVVQRAVEQNPEMYRAEQLSAQEMFQAMHGFGTPAEQENARPEVVEELLEEAKIVGFGLEPAGNRTGLAWIAVKTPEGRLARLSLAAGQGQAVIYKVETHDEQAVRGPDGDTHSDRTQAGPGHPHVDGSGDGEHRDLAGDGAGGQPEGRVPAVRTGT